MEVDISCNSALVLLVSIMIIYYAWNSSKSSQRLPPGPRGIPLLGNVSLLLGDKKPYQIFTDLGKSYGSVYYITIAGKGVLLLNDWETISEAFIKNSDGFNDKPRNTLLACLNKNTGILGSNGSLWQEHRRFTSMRLRNLGVGRGSMESAITDEISELSSSIMALEGAAFDPREYLFPSVLNVTWSVAAGQRFQLGDSRLADLMRMLQENIRISVQSGLLNFMPWLRYVPVLGASYWKLQQNVESIYEFLNPLFDECRQSLDSEGDYSNLLREYLKQAQKENVPGNQSTFTDHQIRRVLTDLFVAGSETTVTTLCWVLLLLVRNPEVQTRLQQEINDAIGQSRLPNNGDRSKMPYVEAVLAEVQRFSSIVPFVTHATPHDVEFRGYRIPKDTIVLGNLWAVMRDPNLWKEPETFNPDRFLDSRGKFMKPEYLIPFSIGKRACLGEALAKAELFMFTTQLLQSFTFKAEEGVELRIEHVSGVTMSPKDFMLIAIPR